MTSNIRASQLKDFGTGVGFGTAARKENEDDVSKGVIESALKKAFAPEFLNRLDAIVQFAGLDDKVLMQVVGKFILELEEQLRPKKVSLKITDPARAWLFKTAYDPAYGARPMARAIDQHIKKPLVDELLFGKLEKGGSVSVDLDEKKTGLKFDIKPA